jgi:FkbM family methyltransferase
MFKPVLQFLLGLTGHAFVSKRRFGWNAWQDISTLMGTVSSPVIFDVGAHTGETLAMAKRQFPSASVYCFEPDPNSFRDLSNLAAVLPGASLHQLALGDVSGSFDFFRNTESMTNSLLPATTEAVKGEVGALMATRQKITVPVITLDDFCEEHRIERIDLLKTDCQGFDLRVLKGSGGMLAQKRINVIQCEAIFDSQYSGQGWFHDVLDFLTSCNYALCGIHDAARNSHHEITFANVLFKPRFSANDLTN